MQWEVPVLFRIVEIMRKIDYNMCYFIYLIYFWVVYVRVLYPVPQQKCS